MSRSLLIFYALLAAVGMGTWSWTVSPAQAQGQPLVVEGQITNGTTGADGVSALTVVLHLEGLTSHDHLEVTADATGRFRFQDILFDPTIVYGVSVRYQDALYGTDLDLSNGSPTPVTLTVYESTDSQDVLKTASASVLFGTAEKSSQTVAALEIIQIVNDSDYTFVPGTDNPMNLLRFGLPPDFQGLQVDTRILGADVVEVDRGFALLASVPPGIHDVMYTYSFPYSGSNATYTKSFPFGVERLRVLSPDAVLTLSSDDMGAPESVTIGERPYQLLQASDLPRETRVSVELTDLPQMSLSDRVEQALGSLRLEYIAPLGLVLVMAFLALYALRRRRGHAVLPIDASAPVQERQTLARLISDIEQNFNAGSLAEEDYHRRRRVLEARLSSLPKS